MTTWDLTLSNMKEEPDKEIQRILFHSRVEKV